MTESSLIRRLESFKRELPHRLHGRLERLTDDIRAQGVEPNHVSPDTPDVPETPDTGEFSDSERVIHVDFLKAEVVLRPADGARLGALWFQKNGLTGGEIVKLSLTLTGLDTLMAAVADVAMKIETGAE